MTRLTAKSSLAPSRWRCAFKSMKGIIGTEVSDSIFLDGVATRFVPESDELITATASGVLAGPLERNSAGTCEGLDWSKAKTVATYDDVVVPDTDKVEGLLKTKLTESGCYSASSTVELTHGDTVIATASHEQGDPTQTVFVKRSSGGVFEPRTLKCQVS